MTKKYICKMCGDLKPEDQFYVCLSHGVLKRKFSCKICFNRSKHENARRKRFLELTEKVKFKKYAKFEEKSERFSSDPNGALRDRDI